MASYDMASNICLDYCPLRYPTQFEALFPELNGIL